MLIRWSIPSNMCLLPRWIIPCRLLLLWQYTAHQVSMPSMSWPESDPAASSRKSHFATPRREADPWHAIRQPPNLPHHSAPMMWLGVPRYYHKHKHLLIVSEKLFYKIKSKICFCKYFIFSVSYFIIFIEWRNQGSYIN